MTYFVHGLTGTPLYKCWDSMKQRCHNFSDASFSRYGKRGIRVCDEWKKDFKAFRAWALSNGYQKGLTLDRKNNNEGYSPENCRWVTHKVQNNNISSNINLTIYGETKSIAEWGRDERCACRPQTLYKRIHNRWKPETALTAPPIKTGRIKRA